MTPRMAKLTLPVVGDEIINVPACTTAAMEQAQGDYDLFGVIKPGSTVAVAVGSRGISSICEVVKTVVSYLKDFGAVPFVIPAMGSHGGATPEGQVKVLESLGITPAMVGCEIRSSMDTHQPGVTKQGQPVNVDVHAHTADHLFLINRVKPHTSFFGKYGSGLLKMLAVGVGKESGARMIHSGCSFDETVEAIWEYHVQRSGWLLGGLGIVENSTHKIGRLYVAPAAQMPGSDQHLLALAAEWMPSLPYEEVDLLIVDEVGKNISGTGMDPHVIGRKFHEHRADPGEKPNVRFVMVRGLSGMSGGNATGIGMAEFAPARLAAQIDWAVTAKNCVTSGYPSKASMPLLFPTDKEAIEAAMSCVGGDAPRVVRIKNTLELGSISVSESLVPGGPSMPDFEEMAFDEAGGLL